MSFPNFALYLHPHTCYTSKPTDQIEFIGHSWPHFNQVRQALEQTLRDYPVLPVREADYQEYARVHTRQYLEKLTVMAVGEPVTDPPRLSLECSGLEYCLPGYRYGLGGMLAALDRMKAGTLERAYCFSLGGHHAYADWGHGYCLLNPQAAAARYAQENGFASVLIVDWDHHHGDGTQSIFAHDPSVHCISIHSLADLYMVLQGVFREGASSRAQEVGHCNIPLIDQKFGDDFLEEMDLKGKYYRSRESLTAFETALETMPWLPDIILIFSGYDAHKDDCGIADWDNETFAALTRSVLSLAGKAGCPVLSVHGGGYQLEVTVSAAIRHVEVLAQHR